MVRVAAVQFQPSVLDAGSNLARILDQTQEAAAPFPTTSMTLSGSRPARRA